MYYVNISGIYIDPVSEVPSDLFFRKETWLLTDTAQIINKYKKELMSEPIELLTLTL
jgi:hypothetical protein